MLSTCISKLFCSLREMDKEADLIRDGGPTGLWWYGGHARRDIERPRTEIEWVKRLSELLATADMCAKREVVYPSQDGSSRLKCDMVVRIPEGKFWIEVKGAWKDYWQAKGAEWIYRSYLLHPLVPGLDQSKTHTVPLDLKKLSTLHKPDADYVGLLLVGFDTLEMPMQSDVEEMAQLAGLNASPWTMAQDSWSDKRRPGHRVRCWLWYRQAPTAQVPNVINAHPVQQVMSR